MTYLQEHIGFERFSTLSDNDTKELKLLTETQT